MKVIGMTPLKKHLGVTAPNLNELIYLMARVAVREAYHFDYNVKIEIDGGLKNKLIEKIEIVSREMNVDFNTIIKQIKFNQSSYINFDLTLSTINNSPFNMFFSIDSNRKTTLEGYEMNTTQYDSYFQPVLKESDLIPKLPTDIELLLNVDRDSTRLVYLKIRDVTLGMIVNRPNVIYNYFKLKRFDREVILNVNGNVSKIKSNDLDDNLQSILLSLILAKENTSGLNTIKRVEKLSNQYKMNKEHFFILENVLYKAY